MISFSKKIHKKDPSDKTGWKEKDHDKGTYVLIMLLAKNQKIKPGKLPESEYRKGTYLYVGRARTRLEARIKRHIQHQKKIHWHIDYLLQKAVIKDIWIRPNFFGECLTAAKIQKFSPAPAASPKGFGSSDCRCPSHLFYFPPDMDSLDSLRKKMGFVKMDMDRSNIGGRFG
jgi:Uri superfamily endonuclease